MLSKVIEKIYFWQEEERSDCKFLWRLEKTSSLLSDVWFTKLIF